MRRNILIYENNYSNFEAASSFHYPWVMAYYILMNFSQAISEILKRRAIERARFLKLLPFEVLQATQRYFMYKKLTLNIVRHWSINFLSRFSSCKHAFLSSMGISLTIYNSHSINLTWEVSPWMEAEGLSEETTTEDSLC